MSVEETIKLEIMAMLPRKGKEIHPTWQFVERMFVTFPYDYTDINQLQKTRDQLKVSIQEWKDNQQ